MRQLDEASRRREGSSGVVVIPEGSENVIKRIQGVVRWDTIDGGICNAYVVVAIPARKVAESVGLDSVGEVARGFTWKKLDSNCTARVSKAFRCIEVCASDPIINVGVIFTILWSPALTIVGEKHDSFPIVNTLNA